MNDPFLIEGPAVISFSGGRTSGDMLARILDRHGGTLPPDVHVVFSNTGDEDAGTLDFVEECSRQWNVPVRWIEFRRVIGSAKVDTGGDEKYEVQRVEYEEVSRATASLDGRPFDLLVEQKQYLPNPTQRFCTAFLKLWPTVCFLFDLGYGYETTHVIGLRADEPSRVAKRKGRDAASPWDVSFPMHAAGLGRDDVLAAWRARPFDLRIPPGAGNCRLCFEKGTAQLRNLIAACPSSVERMVRREEITGGKFHKDRPSFSSLRMQLPLVGMHEPMDGEIGGCSCTD